MYQGTQGKKTGKDKKRVAPYLLRVSARLLLSEVRTIEMRQLVFEWGQSMDCVNNGVTCKENIQRMSQVSKRCRGYRDMVTQN
jgi:hypothetical protein